jgi:putative membrane protein
VIELLAGQGHGWGGGWGGGPWIGLVWVAVWAAVIIGAVYLLRRRPPASRTEPGAEAVLAARYARGDISDEEYRERLAVLRETNA